MMSRAFVNEDAEGPEPTYFLPEPDDPGYDAAAAWALIEGWNRGDPHSAECASGYKWGEPKLRKHVERILQEALERDDERLESLARRFLRKAVALEDQ
jgi:hypothetical protein